MERKADRSVRLRNNEDEGEEGRNRGRKRRRKYQEKEKWGKRKEIREKTAIRKKDAANCG